MSKDDHFQKKNNQAPKSSKWAKIVDRQGRPARTSNSDEAKPTEPLNLTPEQLNDLELDRQLRMLAKMSSSEDSFVDKVIAQTKSAPARFEASPVAEDRARLPVVGPSLTARTSVEAADHSDSVPQYSETVAESSDALAESSSTESANEKTDSHSPTVSRSKEKAAGRRPVTLLALLATVLFVGFFLSSLWWSESASDVADSTNAKTETGKFVGLKGISGSQDQSPEDAVDREALVEQTMEREATDSLAVSPKEIDLEARYEASESVGDTNPNPTLADAQRRVAPAVGVTEDGKAADEENLEDRAVAEYASDGQSWDARLDWNLALRFERNGVGLVTLNGEPVKAIFLKDNAGFLLRKVAAELKRRVKYLENRLGSKVSGSIAVNDSRFSFDDLSQLDKAVEEVDQEISKLLVPTTRVDELMKLRLVYREELFAQRDRLGMIHLASENLSFYTEDEVFTICSVLSATEGILRGMAKERLIWEKENEVLPTKSKLKNQIQPPEFFHFADSGALIPPEARFSDRSMTGIQNLGPLELQQMLKGAPSVDLFRDMNEFRRAKDFVFSNGSPAMKQQLSIDKIDRLLSGVPVTDEARTVLKDRKAQAGRKLSELILEVMRGANSKDGAPMEPLKAVLADRADLQGLPLVMGDECRSNQKETRELKQVSSNLGRTIAAFNGSMGSRDVTQNDAFRNLSVKNMVSQSLRDQGGEPSSQKLKTIDQILQIDHARLRLEMIGRLRKSGSDIALQLLVDKAKFDLEPEVRIAATAALAEMNPDDIRGLLLEGFKYPWHVVAQHSAEALVRLDDQDAVPQLIEMLDLPHPHSPFEDNGALVQRELVGINHMRNCLLCHAPSTNFLDSVRGIVPHTSMPLPKQYQDLAEMTGVSVPLAIRADVTYLEQDFSVVQPVRNSGPWPSDQRIDYVVRKRKLTAAEANKVMRKISRAPNRHREAIIFALRELTGETPADNSSATWSTLTAGRDQGGE